MRTAGASSVRTMSWAGAWLSALQRSRCSLGDVLDLAFTVDYNEHPDFGGVQLTLGDFKRSMPVTSAATATTTA